jgi:hypothetical protein
LGDAKVTTSEQKTSDPKKFEIKKKFNPYKVDGHILQKKIPQTGSKWKSISMK